MSYREVVVLAFCAQPFHIVYSPCFCSSNDWCNDYSRKDTSLMQPWIWPVHHELLWHHFHWSDCSGTFKNCFFKLCIKHHSKNAYQLDPWGSHGPRHTQQNSDLHELFRQIMWLQPPFFSIVAWHFGHSYKQHEKTCKTTHTHTLVFTWIQLDVSLSSSHFIFHNLRYSQVMGSCISIWHLKLYKEQWHHYISK